MDIVLLWVDGEHPKWLERYRQYSGTTSGGAEFAARYHQAEELRYALRSIEQYAPWVRHIFVVHDDVQRPHWLKTKHERLRLIPHSAFIPGEFLPTFSSFVIESFVHRIPNLSESFVCTNDDTFLIRPCEPSTFFEDSKPIVYFSEFEAPAGPPALSDPAWIQALKNAETLLGPARPARKNVAHGFYTCQKKAAERAWHEFPEALLKNARSRVRSATSVAFINHLLPYLMLRHHKAVGCHLPLVTTYRWTIADKISHARHKTVQAVRHPLRGLREIGAHLAHAPKVLCINSGTPTELSSLLSRKFPKPASFEHEPDIDLAGQIR
ncbi:MAG: hypothetical protein KDD51_09630 [Bdellovibrionales bacterium]|nr:hypothetical protein [Bdellovibrionales bacterium]